MKKKTILVAAIAVMLVAALVVGGTLAYFTDTKDAKNTFTVGNVKINLIEQQRNEDGSALVDFKQDKPLYPIVGSAQGEKDKWGMPVAKNYVDKIINVQNTGKSDAYVRVYVAVPTALVSSEGPADNILHGNFGNRFDYTGQGRYNTPGNSTTWNPDYLNWDYSAPEFTTNIGGVDYTVTTYTYTKALAHNAMPGTPCEVGYYLDSRVDYANGHYTFNGNEITGYDLSNGVTIPVFAIGVQADGFTSANAAFDAAFGANYNPWANK